MEKTPETAVLELKQILPVLGRLLQDVGIGLKETDPIASRVLSSSARVRQLSSIVFGSNETFDSFVGRCNLQETPTKSTFVHALEHMKTLISLAESIIENFQLDEKTIKTSEENSSLRTRLQSCEIQQANNQAIMLRLTKESDSFEKQVDELKQKNSELDEKVKNLSVLNSNLQRLVAEFQQRENTYISAIKVKDNKKGLDSDSKEILLASYRRQKTILLRSLTVFQETKAKYGLHVPIDVVHSIEETEKELEQIEHKMANLE